MHVKYEINTVELISHILAKFWCLWKFYNIASNSLAHPSPSARVSGPSWVAQLVRASSPYTKFAGSIQGQGTCKNQPMYA